MDTTKRTFICPITQSEIRVVTRGDEPWFFASDVAKALGYERPNDAVSAQCKKVNKFSYGDSPQGAQPYNIIPESDVYRLILRSNLPSAVEFQDWVCEEVLPSIRRHGLYITDQRLDAMLNNPDLVLSTLAELDKERKEKSKIEKAWKESVSICNVLAQENADMKPKAMVFEAVVADRQPTLVAFVRTLGGINLNRVKAKLAELGYLYRTPGGQYRVYAEFRDTFFAEKFLFSSGHRDIVVLPAGKKELVHLYKTGELSMRRPM